MEFIFGAVVFMSGVLIGAAVSLSSAKKTEDKNNN